MSSSKSFIEAIGIIGAILSALTFISPILQIIRLMRTKNYKQTSQLVFVIAELTSLFWFVRNIRVWDLWTIFPHFFGLPLNILFLTIFEIYKYKAKSEKDHTYKKRAIGKISVIWIVTIGLLLGLFLGVPNNENTNVILTYFAMVFNIILAIAPIQKIMEVIRTKNHRILPIYFTLLMLASAIFRGIYFWLKSVLDFFIPQCAIAFLSILVICLYGFFELKYRRKLRKFRKSAFRHIIRKKILRMRMKNRLKYANSEPDLRCSDKLLISGSPNFRVKNKKYLNKTVTKKTNKNQDELNPNEAKIEINS